MCWVSCFILLMFNSHHESMWAFYAHSYIIFITTSRLTGQIPVSDCTHTSPPPPTVLLSQCPKDPSQVHFCLSQHLSSFPALSSLTIHSWKALLQSTMWFVISCILWLTWGSCDILAWQIFAVYLKRRFSLWQLSVRKP